MSHLWRFLLFSAPQLPSILVVWLAGSSPNEDKQAPFEFSSHTKKLAWTHGHKHSCSIVADFSPCYQTTTPAWGNLPVDKRVCEGPTLWPTSHCFHWTLKVSYDDTTPSSKAVIYLSRLHCQWCYLSGISLPLQHAGTLKTSHCSCLVCKTLAESLNFGITLSSASYCSD